MDGRVIHAKADTAGYADTTGSANTLGGKAESALSVNYAASAGSAPANGGTAWAATVTPNIKASISAAGSSLAPSGGGTWACHSSGDEVRVVASGAKIPNGGSCCFRIA